jgi:hypothetical protein
VAAIALTLKTFMERLADGRDDSKSASLVHSLNLNGVATGVGDEERSLDDALSLPRS